MVIEIRIFFGRDFKFKQKIQIQIRLPLTAYVVYCILTFRLSGGGGGDQARDRSSRKFLDAQP